MLLESAVISENEVLRANEFWNSTLSQINPEIEIVSSSVAMVLIERWLAKKNLPWAKSKSAAVTLNQCVEAFLPILVSGNQDILAEWWQSNVSAFLRWGHWFSASAEIFDEFLELGFCPKNWARGFLWRNLEGLRSWAKKSQPHLIFELGGYLTALEVELIQVLKNETRVSVEFPSQEFFYKHSECLWPYLILEGKSKQRSLDREIFRFSQIESIEFRKFATAVTEVKDCVGQVREWLESGILVSEICIASPEIESYWPTLKMYFAEEGIPIKKGSGVRASSLPKFQQAFALLKFQLGEVEFSYIEANAKSRQSAVEFHKMYNCSSQARSRRDLARVAQVISPHLQESWTLASKDLERRLLPLEFRSSFASLVGELWEELEMEVTALLSEFPRALSLTLSEWTSLLENHFGSTDLQISSEDVDGIRCLNLSSTQVSSEKYFYILGLHEEAFQSKKKVPVSGREAYQLFQDTGLIADVTGGSALEFDLDRILSKSAGNGEIRQILSYSGSDFLGATQGASLLWLSGAIQKGRDLKEVHSPKSTRWDQIQKTVDVEWKRWKVSHVGNREFPIDTLVAATQRRILMDSDFEVAQSARLFAKSSLSFSISSMEKFGQCAFLFAVPKLFALEDSQDVDIEPDASQIGRLLHGVLAELISPSGVRVPERNELSSMLEKQRTNENLVFADELVWESLKQKISRQIIKTVEFELSWRNLVPETETVGTEVAFQIFWDPDSEDFTEHKTSYVFRGVIDRIDRSRIYPEEHVVLDYKSSGFGVYALGSWKEKQKLQLPVYALAIENQWIKGIQGRVVGAAYFVLRDLVRNKGFWLKDAKSNLFDIANHKMATISSDEHLELIKWAKELLRLEIKKILAGELMPNPKDVAQCEQCRWRGFCRASHMN